MTEKKLSDWKPAQFPKRETLKNRLITLEPLDAAKHGDDLWAELTVDPNTWENVTYGPFHSAQELRAWLEESESDPEQVIYAIVDQRGHALGTVALMEIRAEHGDIEIGRVAFGKKMQRTPEGTESIYLLLDYAFRLGNRRVTWRTDTLNDRSMRAAERLGFSYEGLFRQHYVVRGRNRDSAFYSILDSEWPDIKEEYRRWLDPSNFDQDGKQKTKLSTKKEAAPP